MTTPDFPSPSPSNGGAHATEAWSNQHGTPQAGPDVAYDQTRVAPAGQHTLQPQYVGEQAGTQVRQHTSTPQQVNSDARRALIRVRTEVGKAVVGQDSVISGLIIGLIADGHVLLEGVPGVAKTLLVRSLAQALDLKNTRVQFTPDLMPADTTGSLVWDAGSSSFEFRPGPVFTHLLLADEINRTPPKTQSALLEAMEERQVSVDGTPHKLDTPFMVIATQNPVEHEGTYPLPEAQLDRFLLKLEVPLPPRDAEIQVVARHRDGFSPLHLQEAGVQAVATAADLQAARREAATVRVDDAVVAYLVDVVRATRTAPALALGVSPRGATALMRTARAWAWLQGRTFVTPDDVKAMAVPTLAHRVLTRPEADLEGIGAIPALQAILSQVPVPR